MSLGALTTTFTPASTCVQSFSHLYINQTRTLIGPAIAGPLSAGGCFPDNYDIHIADRYYSPGVCPVGYTPACSSSNTISSTLTETVVTCCPSLMACVTPQWSWESTLPCSRILEGSNQMTEMTYLDPNNGRLSMIVSWTPLWYYGLGIQIRFQSTNADAQPGPTGPTNNGNSGGGSPLESAGSTQPEGLSSGAVAGIGIGVTLLVLLVIGGTIGVCVFRRRARKRQQTLASPPPPSTAPYETDGQGLPASAVYKTEIAGHQRPAELYPLHHEAAYGSQVHLAPQELEQPTKIYEAENGMNMPHGAPTSSPLPARQAYELSSYPQNFSPPTPVYHGGLEQQRQRQQQTHMMGQGWAAPQSPGTWDSSWAR
ncbi:Mid2 domain-containing protein [Madurella fahalii]|uniref:Mid2 domain-containing protein n=1 Tax=Madurella fahalii TaxID=1157608 RepID=A0ABQ0GNL7_9PEZI